MTTSFKNIFITLLLINSFIYKLTAQNEQFNYNYITEKQKNMIFQEDFNSNKNAWPIFRTKQKTAHIISGKYILTAKTEGYQVAPKSVKKELPKNFDFEVVLKFSKGSEKFLYYILLKQQIKPNSAKKRQTAIIKKLKNAYKPNEFNKITLRKVKNSYTLYLNEKFIKKSSAEKLSPKNIKLSVAPNSIVVIDRIIVSKLSPGKITQNEIPDSKILIYSPKTERGFLKISDTEIANKLDKSIIVNGKIEPIFNSAKFELNENPVVLSNNGEFRSNYKLKKGENTLIFKLFNGNQLINQKQIVINYETEEISKIIITPETVTNEKRLALIVGNADYQFGGILSNPENDARSMSIALKSIGFDVMEYTNSNQKEMKKAVDEFGEKLKLYEVGLFFYAGHGIQVKGSNYLVPVDANLNSENDVEYDCVNAERILAKMEDAGSKVNIVVLDACRNNPFERSWTRSTQGKGLAFMNAPSGSLIAYATSPGTTASDGSGQNGLYTSALLKHLAIPDITILEMFQQVRSTVMGESDEKQVPWESTSLKGNFYFVKKVN